MRVTVIGAGNVGASAAKRLAVSEPASQIVMFDVAEGQPQGKALDMAQSLAVVGNDTVASGTNDYADAPAEAIAHLVSAIVKESCAVLGI